MNTTLIEKIHRFLADGGQRLSRGFRTTLSSLFTSPSTAPRYLAISLLVVAGLLHWRAFFGPEPLAFDFEDWPKERCYLNILREAITTHTVPLHMDANLQMTQRFLALPETMLAPHFVLLKWMTNQQFVAFHSGLMCLIGLAGCWILARRYDWSAFTLLVFGSIFSFNGFITCRLAVGHFMWAGYYFFPWMLLATLRLMNEPRIVRRWLELSVVVFSLFLTGSFHLAVWWMLFLGVLALARPKLLLPIGAALALGGVLGLFRIAPAAITFGGVHREFGTGYPDLLLLWRAFVSPLIYDTPFVQTSTAALGWWEFDHFVGLPAVLFVLWFALKPLNIASDNDDVDYSALLVAAGTLAIFSLSRFYAPIANAPLPLFNAERVSTRFISVAFVVLLFCAAQRFNRYATRLSAGWQALAVGLLFQTGIELAGHSAAWRPALLEATHGPSTYWENSATMSAHIAHFAMESKYKLVVAASWAISGLTLFSAFIAWLRLRPANSTKPVAT